MKKFVAVAAVALVALALYVAPLPVERADRNVGASGLATETSQKTSSAPAMAGVGAVHAASGVAGLMWLFVTAGLIATGSGRYDRWRRRRSCRVSDAELRDLLGLPPLPLPAI